MRFVLLVDSVAVFLLHPFTVTSNIPSSGSYTLALVAVHLLNLCCSLCCDPEYLQYAFFALISALCCPRSWAQAEWIFNQIRDTFPANELQWFGMGLKHCRLFSIKTVSGTCSINHQWTLDIVSILILMWGILAFASCVHVVIAPNFHIYIFTIYMAKL